MQPPTNKPDEVEALQDFSNRCRRFLTSYVPDFKHCFVAGGIFPRMYHNLPIRDVDVYVDSDDAFIAFVNEYKNLPGISLVKESKRFFKFQDTSTGIGIDLIGFHNPKTRSFVLNFDFTICRCTYGSSGLIAQGTSDYADIVAKKLVFTGRSMYTENDNNLLGRLKKYLDLGFTVDHNELTKMYKFLLSPEAKKYTLEKGYA